MKKLILLLLVVACSACTTVAPRTEQQAVLDSQIEQQVKKSLVAEKKAFLDHVDVYSYNGAVWLGGVVFNAEAKIIAVQDAKKVSGVKEVQDSIQISINGR
jgi:osmotically-inducible protein OsmY